MKTKSQVVADLRAAREKIELLHICLRQIAAMGGNLPNKSLTDRTGPNDAKQRGLMYCHARELARLALGEPDSGGPYADAPAAPGSEGAK